MINTQSSACSLILFLSFSTISHATDVQISQLIDTPDPAIRAGDITYTTSVLNNSADTALGVTLTLPLPATTAFVSVDNGSCNHDGGTPGNVVCNLGSITGDGLGQPVTTINTVIETSSATSSTVTLNATAATTSADSNLANNTLSQITTIDDGADLVVSLTDTPDPVIAGGNVSYAVSVQNLGPNNAATITAINTLPANMTFVSATGSGWSCSDSGQDVTCTRSSGINNTATAPDITITGQVTGAITGTITDTTTVSSTTGDPDLNNNTTTTDTLVGEGTDLSISKAVSPNPVIGGAATTFTLSPRNNGSFTASTAVVTDTLPAGFTFSSVNVTGSGSWSCGESLGVVTCNLASFTTSNTDNIEINTIAPASGTFSNTAQVSSATADPDSSNNSGSVLNINIVPDGADLSIAKTKTPNPVAQGSPITSGIVVTNNGPQATSGVLTVTDVLSSGETYQSFSGSNWSCSHTGGSPGGTATCTYSATPLASSATTTSLAIVTTATNAGTLTNTASVSDVGGTVDGVPSNNSTSATVESTAAIADLQITKSANAAGDSTLTTAENTITYSLVLTNNGPDDLTDPLNGAVDNAIVITDTISSYVSGVTSATPSATGVTANGSGSKFTCSTGSTVTCTLNDGETFTNGEIETFTISVTRPLASGSINNTATVSSSVLGDDDSGNNTSNTTNITVDAIADVEMTSKTISPDPVTAGTNATYVLSFRNNGPSTAANVTVQDVFSPPSGRTYTVISVTPSNSATCDAFGSNAANTLDCTFGTLSRNTTRTITVVIRPDWDGNNNAWSMSNTATVSTTTAQSRTDNDSKTATLNVNMADLDLLVNKTDLSDPVGYTPSPGAFPGSLDNVIVYKVDITNRGPSLSTGTTLTDVMTPKSGKQLTFLCDDSGSSSCTVGTSTCNNTNVAVTGPASLTLTCPQSNLAASATSTRYLFFQVDTAPDSTGDTHNNVASIDSAEDDLLTSNDTESETTSVRVRVDIGVTKAASLANVSLNQPFDWDIVVFNNGPGNSAQTALSDTLPAGMVLTATPTTGQGSCTGIAGGTSFTCSLGTVNTRSVSGVADSNDVAITVPVKVTSYPTAGHLTNTASVTTLGVDTNSANNSDSDIVTIQKSSLAGFVYSDLNNNGAKDGGENGIQNVTVTLTGTDAYGFVVNTPATTLADGSYLFDNLSPSNGSGYTLTETHPSGYLDGLDNASGSLVTNSRTTDVISTINVAANTALTNYLFGEILASSLSGLIWHDESNDGILDGAETTRLANTNINLSGTDDLGNAVNTDQTTNVSGQYSFTDLRPGTYSLTETQVTGYLPGLAVLGTGANVTGTADNATASVNFGNLFSGITLTSGNTAIDYNFSEVLAAGINGKVIDDLNNDGIHDLGEPGIAGVTITLTGTDVFSAVVNIQTTTDANGVFSFPGIQPGTYTLTETQPVAYLDGIDTAGNLGGTVANDVISNIVLADNQSGTNYIFAERGASIVGTVYVDSNNNGIKEGSETGIPNVTLTLTGVDTDGNTVNTTVTTDASGDYLFSGLRPSNTTGYTVTETHPSAWADGLDTAGTIGGVAGNDVIDQIVINSTTQAKNYNFGERGASLAGVVFNDLNNNGIEEGTEPGIPGTTVTLTGTDINGNSINIPVLTGDDGTYSLPDLPLSNPSGYTITETQPADNSDGIDSLGSLGGVAGNDVFSGITFPTAGASGTEYNFGETTTNGARLSGRVWFDNNHDRVDNENSTGQATWIVELIKRTDPLDNTAFSLVATAETNTNGDYAIEGITPGSNYEIRFRHPQGGYIYGGAVSNEPGVDLSFGTIRSLTVPPNGDIPNQNLPVDPSGVVYDALTRQPVPGAIVTFSGPAGFDPDVHLVGGSGNITQTMDSTGIYQYLIFTNAPAGVYTLAVTPPTGYLPGISTFIPPCTNTINVGSIPNPALVQNNASAPAGDAAFHNPSACPSNTSGLAAGANGTQYFLSFTLNPTLSANVINNHIPLDPITEGALTLVKSSPKVNVTRGELVPYTVQITNNLSSTLTNINIRDQIPPGFKYIANSSVIDSVRTEPLIEGRSLTWSNLIFTAGQQRSIDLLLIVGSGVGEGEYVNQAWAINNLANARVSNIATATVRVVPDPTFDCSDLIGKVFDDKNTNGYQDQGEPGLASIRLATARGLIISTDSEGRYHVPCAAVPAELSGSNFILKLDEQTLPSGYRVTTENPRVVRLTRGKLAKLNFGAAIHRVVRVDLNTNAFDLDHKLNDKYHQQLEELIETLSQHPSILRVTYAANNEERKQIEKRLAEFKQQIEQHWEKCVCHHELIIESEVLWENNKTPVSNSTGRAEK